LLSGRVKTLKLGFHFKVPWSKIQLIVIIAFGLWSLLSLNLLNSGVLVDFRDITSDGYLTLSDTFAIFSIAYLSKPRLRALNFAVVMCLSLATIFLLGSRTTLLLFPLAVVF